MTDRDRRGPAADAADRTPRPGWPVKINQYCSVCKKHLDMEVIPTDDGGDDGVIWLRCPECQGFLPKFTGDGGAGPAPRERSAKDRAHARAADSGPARSPDAGHEAAGTTSPPGSDPSDPSDPSAPSAPSDPAADPAAEPVPDGGVLADLGLPPTEPDSLADGAESAAAAPPPGTPAAPGTPEARAAAGSEAGSGAEAESGAQAEPVAEYAARLAEADPAAARPYRPTDTYAEGDLLHHLAYDDLGIVVAKETLPGGRPAVKVFFEEAGVVRLIEQAGGR